MISSTTTTIGGRTVQIFRCTAVEALDLELSILRAVGKVDVASLTQASTGDLHGALTAGLLDMFGGMAKNLSHAELLRLMNMLFQYVTIDGQKFRDINESFADRPRDVWQVFVEAIKHNLGPLVGGLLTGSNPANPSTK
jgi:hypothetical protein